MTKSMTGGRPIRLILQFAFPLLLGNLFQQTYNMVDAAIVGRTLGAAALGSVGASSSVNFLILGFCIGLACGFAIPVAQAFGADDRRMLRSCVFHSWILTAAFAAVLTVACSLLTPQILHLLQTPDDLYADAYAYLLVIFLGIPFTMLYNLCSGILRAVGDSRTPFLFLAFSAVLNIGLDLFCILVLGWGTAGAAIATIASQGISGILCFFYMRRKYALLRVGREERRWNPRTVRKLLLMGIPMGLQYSITAIGSMVMQSANNSLGSLYTSAFAAGVKIKQLTMCPFDAIATGVSTFAGQNYGAGKVDRIRNGIRSGTMVAVLYGLLAGFLLILGGRTMSLLFVSSSYQKVLDASGRYLRCMGYFYWTLGILNTIRMSIQGLGFSGRAIFSGVIEMIARTFVSLVFVPIAGYTAICYADQTAWVTSSIYCVIMLGICMKTIRTRTYRRSAAEE